MGFEPPEELLSFLRLHGNGGYIENGLCLDVPPSCGHSFFLRSFIGIGHPDPNLDLLDTLLSFKIDDQLPREMIPVFEDSWGSWLCVRNDGVSGVFYWCPDEGEPEKFTRVADSLEAVLEASGPCPELPDEPAARFNLFKPRTWFGR